MNSTFFENPVTVLVGLGFPRTIESAEEAYQLLSEMPGTGSERRVALNACRAALEGKIDPATARAAFVAFSRRSAMMLEDPHIGDGRLRNPSMPEVTAAFS